MLYVFPMLHGTSTALKVQVFKAKVDSIFYNLSYSSVHKLYQRWFEKMLSVAIQLKRDHRN